MTLPARKMKMAGKRRAAVTVSNGGTDGYVIADAVWLVRVEE